MKRDSKIVRYSSEELKAMPSATDWARVNAMTDEEIEAADTSDEGIGDDWMERGIVVRNSESPLTPPVEIRKRLNLSQHAFAVLLGVSVRTIQDWEQGRRQPSGPAKTLLRIIDQNPEALHALR
jgi:putative transcriptional regulator